MTIAGRRDWGGKGEGGGGGETRLGGLNVGERWKVRLVGGTGERGGREGGV